MKVGLVYPSPGVESYIDPHLLSIFKTSTLATHCRFNIDYRHPTPQKLLDAVLMAGFEPLPILDFTYDHEPDMATYLAFCEHMIRTNQLKEVEILNEPRVMGQWDGTKYGQFAKQVCDRLSGLTTLILSGDYLQPDRKGPQIHRYWMDDVRVEVPDDAYQKVAWHTYREPASPDTTRYKNRTDEYEAMYEPLPPGKHIQVTEVGWNLISVSQKDQAHFIKRELDINQGLGIEITYIYAPVPGDETGDFGLFNHDWTPRPSAEEIRKFMMKPQSQPL